MTGSYAVGERVRVLAGDPPGHVRTPWYVRGKAGVIERVCGTFENPERLAYGRSGDRRVLYRVRFDAAELWPEGGRDVVEVEIYEHWLEKEAE